MAKLELNIPSMELPDGNKMPMIAFGVGTAWSKKGETSTKQELIDAVKIAITSGYRHLDGSESYGTEYELGQAIKQSKIPREELFVVTKASQNVEDIPNAITASLKALNLDYVDLYLMHTPFWANGDMSKIQQAWKDMEDVLRSGKAKSIGVSNFTRPELEAILQTCQARPAVNQIEFHPYLQHGDLIAYMKNVDIKISAYGPQAPVTKATGGPLDPVLASLAKKYAVNPSEILLRWCVDQNVTPIITTSKEQRMSDMLRIFTFDLTPKELENISKIGNTHHFRAFWTAKFKPDDRS